MSASMSDFSGFEEDDENDYVFVKIPQGIIKEAFMTNGNNGINEVKNEIMSVVEEKIEEIIFDKIKEAIYFG